MSTDGQVCLPGQLFIWFTRVWVKRGHLYKMALFLCFLIDIRHIKVWLDILKGLYRQILMIGLIARGIEFRL